MNWEMQQLKSLVIENPFTRLWNYNTEIPVPESLIESGAGFEPTIERDT